jgi:DNA invertase Pin-like site-specific DNA recombinase
VLPVGWFDEKPTTEKKAVAYYRHSAQDKQEYSVEIQQEHVRKFASDHGIEIIKEFADRGITGVVVKDRDAFNEMIQVYVEGGKEKFDYVLVFDVSRWGRFQDGDESAHYTWLCSSRGVKVVFSTMGFQKENDLFYGVYLNFERWRAARYSQELSGKVWKGCSKIASYGYWAGGMAPYGMQRLLLDEQKSPVRVLVRGEHKAIHNQRTTLKPGDEDEVDTIREIFKSFVHKHRPPDAIADTLNQRQILSPGKRTWTRSAVYSILRNEIYAGTMVWNKTSQKLNTKSINNSPADWVRTEAAFQPIVSMQVFTQAQQIIHNAEEALRRKYSDADMLSRLDALYRQYGTINHGLIASTDEMVSPARYIRRFHSLNMAYQAMFSEVIAKRKTEIIEMVRAKVRKVDNHEDFIVINGYGSMHIQPCVPFPCGYEAYWSFRPDTRDKVDVTLGVPLSNNGEFQVLGYAVFPRLMTFKPEVTIRSTTGTRWDMYSWSLADVLANFSQQKGQNNE